MIPDLSASGSKDIVISCWVRDHESTSVFEDLLSELAGVFTMRNLGQGRRQKRQEEKDSISELSLDTTSATGADGSVLP